MTNFLREALIDASDVRRRSLLVLAYEALAEDPDERLPLTSLMWCVLQELVDLDVAERSVLEQLKNLRPSP